MSAQTPPPFPSNGQRRLSPLEQLQRARAMACLPTDNKPRCEADIYIGLFFDGTGNNMRDHQPKFGHSNVVRLYNAHPDRPQQGLFRFYMPGVGTPFPEIGELGYSTLGKAASLGGEQRINWGLLRIYNAINRFYTDQNIINDDQAKTISDNMSARVSSVGLIGQYRRMVLHTWEEKLKAMLKGRKPTLKQINISVYGFSRGAAEARAFCNWFFELCEQKDGGYTFAGVPVRIYFLGLFDTVASVGLANLVSITEGHMAWADDNMHVNPAVEQCVHYVAAHEARACFPMDSVRNGSSYPPNCKEVVYPGMHSDVGGGYMPKDQGKSPSNPGNGKKYDFLALLPGIDMYHEARKAGVPLKALDEMPAQIRRDFEPDPEMVRLYNDYLAKSGIAAAPVESMAQAHMNQYFSYRRQFLHEWERRPFFGKASPESQEHLKKINEDLADNFTAIQRSLSNPNFNRNESVAIHPKSKSMLHPTLAPLDDDTIAITQVMQRAKLPAPEVVEFFDSYVHDSMAGFSEDGVREYTVNSKGLMRYRKIFSKDG